MTPAFGSGQHLKCTSHSLPEPSPNKMAQFYEDDQDMLADAVADCLPPPEIIAKTSPANYASMTFNFSLLVDLCSAHETHQAKKSCRTQQKNIPESTSQRQELTRTFNAIIKQNGEQRLRSGLHRQLNYGSLPSTAGNTANAKLAATARSNNVRYTPTCLVQAALILSSLRPRKFVMQGSRESGYQNCMIAY